MGMKSGKRGCYQILLRIKLPVFSTITTTTKSQGKIDDREREEEGEEEETLIDSKRFKGHINQLHQMLQGSRG